MQLRYSTWFFSTVLVGTLMEIVGYVFRILASKLNPYAVSYFVGQYFCIVVAPVFYSASIYTLLSVMINCVGHEYAPVRPKFILWTFIVCDVIATVVQVTGAGLIGSAYSSGKDPNGPNHILLGGLAFQVFTYAIFIILYIVLCISHEMPWARGCVSSQPRLSSPQSLFTSARSSVSRRLQKDSWSFSPRTKLSLQAWNFSQSWSRSTYSSSSIPEITSPQLARQKSKMILSFHGPMLKGVFHVGITWKTCLIVFTSVK